MEMHAQSAPGKTALSEVEWLRMGKLAAERELVQTREEVAYLRHELAQLKRMIFGTRSERFEPESPDQLGLFLRPDATAPPAQSETTTTTRTKQKEKRKPVRQPFPSHLPRETVVIEPEGDTSLLKRIGAEVTETLLYHPSKLIILRRERPKYVDPANEDRGVIIAPLPARPIDKGIAEPSLLASVTIEKYVDHLPLYRQVQRFTRMGITMAASTLGDWVSGTADLLVPLYNELVKEAKESGYIQADETPIQVQDGDKKGKTHRGWYWVYHAREPGIVIMDYQAGRGRDGPRALLAGYEGLLQCDGYQVYDQFEQNSSISIAGCWAHARRYFFDAKGSAAERSEHVLNELSLLYDIERELREENASPEERHRVRQAKARPILDGLKKWLQKNEGLPRAPWGKAVSYTLTRWDRLTAYLEEGRLEIDNNLVENAIRPVALGRKNYLFSGSHDAAQRAAVIYSLLATCKKHDVNPQVWLTDVLTRIPTHPAKKVADLLPHHWKCIQG